MPKGGQRIPVGGRPAWSTKPAYLKRVQCTGIRLSQWLLDWLMSQPRSGGRIIEEALVEKYRLTEPNER